jgi:hypothetical protein
LLAVARLYLEVDSFVSGSRADLTNNLVRVVDHFGMRATAIFDDPPRSFGARIGRRLSVDLLISLARINGA